MTTKCHPAQFQEKYEDHLLAVRDGDLWDGFPGPDLPYSA